MPPNWASGLPTVPKVPKPTRKRAFATMFVVLGVTTDAVVAVNCVVDTEPEAEMLVPVAFVNEKLVTVSAVAVALLKMPVEGVEAPMLVPLMLPPVIETFALDKVPMVPLVENRLVDEASVAKKFVVVAFAPVALVQNKLPVFQVVAVPLVALNEVANNEVAVALVVVTFARVVPPRTVSVDVTVELDMMMPPKA